MFWVGWSFNYNSSVLYIQIKCINIIYIIVIIFRVNTDCIYSEQRITEGSLDNKLISLIINTSIYKFMINDNIQWYDNL